MGGRLAGKTALITSAAQGIGRATVLAMVAEGAKVIATDINMAALEALAKESPAISIHKLDVTKQAEIDALAAKVYAPDVLFNCSGYVHAGTILDVVDKDWDFAFELNVRAHYRMMRAFTPRWLERGSASVINMASLASSVKGVPNRFLYGTSKAAVIGMTKAMAADYLAKGIRVNAICPGTVDTPSLHDRMRATGDYEAAHKAFVSRQPMGRLGRAEEIAALVVYLASDESAFITGQAINIDGGWSV
ncbi:SDR family oxidoreductase [Aestuariivirga sp.]|uniref:SDR family oxidoreductase n=1 Tax=Aestuariivirga sp. TaxID=2650926 RepID=UPI0039E316F8